MLTGNNKHVGTHQLYMRPNPNKAGDRLLPAPFGMSCLSVTGRAVRL